MTSIASRYRNLSAADQRRQPLTRVALALAAALLCSLFAPSASATCHVPRFGRVTALPGASSQSGRMAEASPEAEASPAADESNAPASRDVHPGSIVGLWKVDFNSGGQTVDQAFEIWHGDGTEVLNDTTPPAEGNVCFGVWTQSGPRTFRLKHPSWAFDPAGNLVGTVMIRETVTLTNDGNRFHGTATVEFFDLAGNSQGSEQGTISGTRVEVD